MPAPRLWLPACARCWVGMQAEGARGSPGLGGDGEKLGRYRVVCGAGTGSPERQETRDGQFPSRKAGGLPLSIPPSPGAALPLRVVPATCRCERAFSERTPMAPKLGEVGSTRSSLLGVVQGRPGRAEGSQCGECSLGALPPTGLCSLLKPSPQPHASLLPRAPLPAP